MTGHIIAFIAGWALCGVMMLDEPLRCRMAGNSKATLWGVIGFVLGVVTSQTLKSML